MNNIYKFFKGIRLFPVTTSQIDSKGELEVDSVTGKLQYHNGTTKSAVVTETHSATLTGKTIDADQNTITNIENADIKALAGIEYSKLALTGSIVNADVSATAAIADTKLDTISTAGKVSNSATTATNANTPSTIVARDATGNFSAGTITANVTGNVSGSAASFTGSLAGDVTGTQGATVVSTVGTSSAANINSAELLANAATNTNTASTIVKRDGSGNFSAGTITANITGNVSGTASNVTGTVAIANGGTGQTTQQAAINALTGTQGSGKYLRSDGTNASLSSIQAADVPTLNQNTTGTASNVTGVVAIANGGTGQTTANSALNALLPSQTANNGKYLTTDGTNTSWATVAGGGGGGSSTYTAVAGETLTAGQAVYIASSTDVGRTAGRVYKLDASNSNRIEFAGVVTVGATSGLSATITVAGQITGLSGLISGQPVFASVSTPGSYQTSAPLAVGHYIIQIGIADSTTSMILNGALSSTATEVTNGTTPSTIHTLKNFVIYSNFENNSTTGWSLFNTTLTSKIPTGSISAGAASLTTFGTTTSALSGNYSLQIGGSGVITAGQGIISDDFLIDVASQSKVLTFKFDYRVDSGASNLNLSGTSNNTFAVYFYDVANSTWRQPAGVYNFVQSSGVGSCSGTFQTEYNATSYRLAIVCVNSSAGAATLTLDNFYAGPQVVQYGAPVTDWVSYTPTVVGMTVSSTAYCQWRRVGDSIQIEARFSNSAVSASNLSVSLPFNYVIDINKISINGIVGHATAQTGVSSVLRFNVLGQGAGTTLTFGTNLSNSNGNTLLAATDILSFFAQVPITGWSSTVQMSNDTDTRVVAAAYTSTVSTTCASGVDTVLDFNSKVFDTHNAVSGTGSNWRFTCPVPGIYRVSAQALFNFHDASIQSLQIFKNGVLYRVSDYMDDANAGGQVYSLKGTTLLSLNSGDYISVIVAQNSGISRTTVASYTNFEIERLSGPSAIAASETVAMRYSTAAAPSVANNTATAITFGTKSYDTHNAYSGSTYTVPVSGKYRFSMALYSAATTATFTDFQINCYKNGSIAFGANFPKTGNFYGPQGGNLSGTIDCIAGDTLVGRWFQNSGGNLALLANGDFNWLCIERVGN